MKVVYIYSTIYKYSFLHCLRSVSISHLYFLLYKIKDIACYISRLSFSLLECANFIHTTKIITENDVLLMLLLVFFRLFFSLVSVQQKLRVFC